MDKLDILTDEALRAHALNSEFVRYIERFREILALERGDLRILDWGCGRGQAVIQLRRLGYQAFGADIDPQSIDNGRAYLAAGNGDPRWLQVIEGGRLAWPDGSFHFVFSETVLEHVAELEPLAKELYRMMACPAVGLHVFPARHGIVEQHLRMPFVHWTPKNTLRRWIILLYVALGVEPRWSRDGLWAKARQCYEYSISRTFYRRRSTLRSVFEKQGFGVEFVAADHPRIAAHRLLGPASRSSVFRPVVSWGVNEFKMVELLLTKGLDGIRPRE